MNFKDTLCLIPILRDFRAFKSTYFECASFPRFLFWRYFPSSKGTYCPTNTYSDVRGRIVIGKCAKVGHRKGCYIQGRGKLFFGDHVEVAPNCSIISGNHGLLDHNDVEAKETIIGDHCWIASNSCILAGVILGPRTVVGAGSVVTKSFPEGYCVIAGNPAKIIKKLDCRSFVKPKSLPISYYGYIRADKFEEYYNKNLRSIKFEYDLSKVTENPIFQTRGKANL